MSKVTLCSRIERQECFFSSTSPNGRQCLGTGNYSCLPFVAGMHLDVHSVWVILVVEL